MPSNQSIPPSGVEANSPEIGQAVASTDVLDAFHLPQQHLRLTQVTFNDQTDIHNELVFEREWLLHTAEQRLELSGNLFDIRDVLSGKGHVLLKAEALPHARPQPRAVDLSVAPAQKGGFDFCLYGQGEDLIRVDYEGGDAGRSAALHACQQARRPDTPAHRVPRFLSNTWGDRSRDSRIRQDFIAREIEAGARLGVEVVQIDDGWMRGVTKNSARAAQTGGVWEGFWNQDADFWQTSRERFPDGLEPLVERARALGMQLGLWFGPDSWQDFAHWQRDAECLLDFYRRLGIAYFKMDGIRMDSIPAQTNLKRLFASVLEGSRGEVVFDLDVTAQTRPGYFGAMEAGPLFVENRYTDWQRYWPHQTLRNLWKLARWVDPRRLRMEWLNPYRNTEKYPSDPLAPAAWAPDALFATVMYANPLGWFEVSNLPAEVFERAAPLVAVWKRERADLFAGTILPVGNAPDGTCWCGFVTLQPGGKAGTLLLFRELGGEVGQVHLPGVPAGRLHCRRLAGTGRVSLVDGVARASGVAPLGYILARFEA